MKGVKSNDYENKGGNFTLRRGGKLSQKYVRMYGEKKATDIPKGHPHNN